MPDDPAVVPAVPVTKVAGVTSGVAVTGLTNGLGYYFVVTAVNVAGESVESAMVSAKPHPGKVMVLLGYDTSNAGIGTAEPTAPSSLAKYAVGLGMVLGSSAFGSCLLMPNIAALEIAGWSMAGLRRGPWLASPAAATRQAMAVTAALVGVRVPRPAFLIRGSLAA